jgi:hypothetical protein
MIYYQIKIKQQITVLGTIFAVDSDLEGIGGWVEPKNGNDYFKKKTNFLNRTPTA